MAKKLPMVMLAVLVGVLLCGNAMAIPMTWTDVIDDDVQLNATNRWYIYTHDLTGDGPNSFDPSEDFIYSFNLVIDLTQYSANSRDTARIFLPFLLPAGTVNSTGSFSYESEDHCLSIFGLMQLNSTGELTVSINRVSGDFWFDKSTLEASGCETNPTPVSEGNAMIVLGAGLFGLGGCARRMFKS